MSEAAINAALKRMGIDAQKEFTGHGVCPIARTILANDSRSFSPGFVARQCDHRQATSIVTGGLGRNFSTMCEGGPK